MITNLTVLFMLIIPLLSFSSPHIGILIYYWFTHIGITDKWTGGLGIPFGKIYAAIAVLSWMFSKERKLVKFDGTMIILFVFYFWTIFTAFFANYPDAAWSEIRDFSTIVMMIPVLAAVINTRLRLHALIWMLAIAIGFNTVPAGIAAALSGGSASVVGLPGSIYNTENTLARGAILVVPLLMFLYVQTEKQWARYMLLAAAGFSVLCLIGTGSRGGLIGFAAMMAWVWLKSKRKTILVILALVAGGVMLVTISEQRLASWTGRMETIREASSEATANQRFEAWEWAIQLANKRPIIGGGFGAFRGHVIETSRGKQRTLLAHSNYFQALGEHGYVGLTLYLALCFAAFRGASKIFQITRNRPDMRYERDMAFMIQVMLVGYFVGGATITHTYYELFYVLIGVTRVLREQVDIKLAGQLTENAGPHKPGRPAANPFPSQQPGHSPGALSPHAPTPGAKLPRGTK